MLYKTFHVQHTTLPCQHNNVSRLGSNSIRLQHKRCLVVQPRSPLKVSKVSATQNTSGDDASSSSNSGSPFFNREMELQCLKDLCATAPESISVIVGPRNAGKTALLKEYMRDRCLTGSRCFIAARSTPITSPNELAKVLLDSAIPKILQQFFPSNTVPLMLKIGLAVMNQLQDKLKLGAAGELTVSGKAVEAIRKALAGDTERPPKPLPEVTAGYTALLDAWDKANADGQLKDPRPPVLVIDEANVLMTWGDQYKTDRQTLLRFFVAISKEQNRSHVLLATSDFSFHTWLSEEIGNVFETFVIGDFPAREARLFLDQRLQRVDEAGVSDAEWEAVYKTCGGNAGALRRAATARHTSGGWEAALSRVTKDVWRTMQPGYLPAPDAGYTAADYATAVDAILKNPYNAVVDDDIVALIGQQSLEAMVQANQLALRPYSSWARDIDVAAFGPEQDATVVTAPTAVHLYHMGRKRNIILAALNSQQVPARSDPVRSSSPGQSRSSSPTSDDIRKVADKIVAVEDNIAVIDGRIQQVDADMLAIRTAKEEGWLEELAVLQQKQQYLVEEKRQLRLFLSQLQEKELLLMKRDE